MTHLIPYSKYREYPALNYSSLKNLDEHPSLVRLDIKRSSDAMDRGSLIDTLLTNEKDFEKLFHIMSEDKPTSTLLVLYENLINILTEYNETDIVTQAEILIKDLNLWSNIKNPDLIQQRIKDPILFSCIKEHFESQNKIKIYQTDYNNSKALIESLKTHEFTSKYFNSNDTVEILNQVPIVFKYKDFEYKVLIDILYIDHWNKLVIPIDLKTSEDSVNSFKYKIYKFRYDIQASMYHKGVIEYCNLKYPDYQIEDFLFLVGSLKYPETPLLYNARGLMSVGEFGNNEHKGFLELSESYFWHRQNDKWDYSKEVYLNNGIVFLNE